MAEISVDFRNIPGARKCAVSSPRIISLEIGDESTGNTSESAFNGYFLNGQVSRNEVKNNGNLIRGCDKKFLIHSQSSLSISTCDERHSDKIKSTDNNYFDLCDLLNSVKLAEAEEKSNSTNNTSDDKMKINSNGDVIDGLSDLLPTFVHDTLEKDDVNTTNNYCRQNNTQGCGIDLLDFDFTKNESVKGSLSSNNSSLKVEGNLSELLSSINIEDSDGSNFGSFNSSNVCNSKVVNKFEKEPCVANLSDLLSSIDLGNSNDASGTSKVVNKFEKEPCVANLSDLLSSIDLGNSNDASCNPNNIKVAETKNESCLADLLQAVNIDKSDKPALTFLNNKPLSFDSTNLFSKGTNGISDSLNDFASDLSCSSSNSCASSFSEREDNSPQNSLTKNKLTDKVFESDSCYGSSDSALKEFSFFNYSSDNQLSFNTFLTNKSDVNKTTKHDCKNTNEEMSMSDLLTIVSPDFKNPILATLNKTEKLDSSLNEDDSSMLDLIESLNIKSKTFDCDDTSNKLVQCDQKLMGHDCVDGRISKKVQNGIETIDSQADDSLEKDRLIGRSYIVSDGDNITNGDDQITFIDLRECIKSAKHTFTPKYPIKPNQNENRSLECVSPNKIQFHCEEKPEGLSQNSSNPFDFNDSIPKKKIRVNSKQTMFSKALACKPKKDQSLLQKVANIKIEILSNIMYRPVLIDCDVPQPIVESVLQSDRCILSNKGRISFGLDASCELQ